MAGYVIEPIEPNALLVQGTDESFPVHRIYCVGRNYAAHAREMGSDPAREEPFFFCKPADAAYSTPEGTEGTFAYPPATEDCHYEAELVVAIEHGGRNIRPEHAQRHIYGYAVGLDMTRRDLQNFAKQSGRPWEAGKAFAGSAPIGPIVPAANLGHPESGAITLSVNGTERQSGDLRDMIWSTPEIIAHLSTLFELHRGDLIFTGTPEGVGAIVPDDHIHVSIDKVGDLAIRVTPAGL